MSTSPTEQPDIRPSDAPPPPIETDPESPEDSPNVDGDG